MHAHLCMLDAYPLVLYMLSISHSRTHTDSEKEREREFGCTESQKTGEFQAYNVFEQQSLGI